MVEIKNIRWNERKREFYARVYVNGELEVVATLEYCVRRAKEIAENEAAGRADSIKFLSELE